LKSGFRIQAVTKIKQQVLKVSKSQNKFMLS
jgi:hypothetical protein